MPRPDTSWAVNALRVQLHVRTTANQAPRCLIPGKADLSNWCSADMQVSWRCTNAYGENLGALNAPAWLGSTVEHEGHPLALRVRPHADSTVNRERLPHLVAVTHHLDRVREDGLPEAAYNNELAAFDADVIESLERYGKGLVALIETLAGRRTYYAYAKGIDLGMDALVELQEKYPGHRVTESRKASEGWALFARYRELFPW